MMGTASRGDMQDTNIGVAAIENALADVVKTAAGNDYHVATREPEDGRRNYTGEIFVQWRSTQAQQTVLSWISPNVTHQFQITLLRRNLQNVQQLYPVIDDVVNALCTNQYKGASWVLQSYQFDGYEPEQSTYSYVFTVEITLIQFGG